MSAAPNASGQATPRGPLNLFDILQASGFDKDAAADIVRNERLKRFARSVLGNELTVEKNPPSMVDKRPVIRIDPEKVRSFASRIAKTAV